MEIIDLAATTETPGVLLDKGKSIFEITGRSLSQDAAKFYAPVLDWLRTYSSNPNPATVFSFKLEYINTSSSKIILDILSILSKIPGAQVSWYFQDEDEDMEEAGEEFAELVDIPFEFKAY